MTNLTMPLLTATNERVQFTISFSGLQTNKKIKTKRLEVLKESLQDNTQLFFDEVFPRKQATVLDTILYYLSGSGIAKTGRDSLANKCDCSIRTVSSVVEKIREMPFLHILVGKLKGTNKYVFVDLLHQNAKEILREVFDLSDKEIAYRYAHHFAHPQNAETLEAVSLEGQNESPNCLTDLSKQTNQNIISLNKEYLYSRELEAIKKEIENNAQNNREYVVKYASNPFQIAFYDFLNGFPLPNSMEEVKSVLALRVGSNATAKTYSKATNLIMTMTKRIKEEGYQFENVVAAFTRGLEKAMKYVIPERKKPQGYNWLEEQEQPKKGHFYNWLEERE